MSENKPLTKAEVKQFVAEWYHKLDVHAPQIEVIPMLAAEGLQMKFPEATLKGLADFEQWYQGVIRIFFDEVHKVKKAEPVIKGDRAEVAIIVRWEASRWRSPAANSDRIVLDAYQTWTVRREASGKLVIAVYTVDRLVYAANSAKL